MASTRPRRVLLDRTFFVEVVLLAVGGILGDTIRRLLQPVRRGRGVPRRATQRDLVRLYRPPPGLPLTPHTMASGQKRLVCTTFTAQQIALDVHPPVTRTNLLAVLDTLAAAGVARVRLDAGGYAVKTPDSPRS